MDIPENIRVFQVICHNKLRQYGITWTKLGGKCKADVYTEYVYEYFLHTNIHLFKY